MSERNAVGSWKQVGYVAPGATKSGENGATTNFSYIQADAENSGALTKGSDTFGKLWAVDNKVALNDCAIGTAGNTAANANWTIEVKNTSNGNSVVYVAAVPKPDCEQLTPSFTLIGK